MPSDAPRSTYMRPDAERKAGGRDRPPFHAHTVRIRSVLSLGHRKRLQIWCVTKSHKRSNQRMTRNVCHVSRKATIGATVLEDVMGLVEAGQGRAHPLPTRPLIISALSWPSHQPRQHHANNPSRLRAHGIQFASCIQELVPPRFELMLVAKKNTTHAKHSSQST